MVRRTLAALIIILFFLLIRDDSYGDEHAARPKIGVVLSGGGAKGFAHIAVLRKIEELNIPVDYIGGTSMGSIIAALYAMGYTVDELDSVARETDWYKYFTNKPDRDNTSLIQKIYFYDYPLNLDVTKDGISIPRGLVNGQKTGLFLSRLTWGGQHVKNYRTFPIPFLCIGTDFESGKQEIFDSGIIAQSLRASMAIPTVFDPVEINGRGYLDGGVVNNFPVQEVKDMGADIIIGVDVSSRLYKKEDLTSVPKIMDQAISFLGEAKTMEQRELCDILIIPSVANYEALDFDKTDEIIKSGEEAALQQIDKLEKLSKEMSSYSIEKRGRIVNDKRITIDSVKLHNLKLVSQSVVTQYLNISSDDKVTADDIEKAINMIYGLSYFERVSYNIDRSGGKNILNVYFEESSESHLSLGVSFDTDLKEALLGGFEIRNLIFKNTEAIIKARIGEYSNLNLTYLVYTPFDPGGWFDINWNIYNMDFFLYQDGNKNAVYTFWYNAVSAGLNFYYSNWMLLSFKAREEFYNVNTEIAYSGMDEDGDFNMLAFAAGLTIDTLDRKSFSTRGFFVEGEFDYVRKGDSSYSNSYEDEDFKRGMLNLIYAAPLFKRFALHLGGASSIVTSSYSPPTYWMAMGGTQYYENWIFPLYGYNMMEVTAANGWFYFIDLQFEFLANFFLTAKWNAGKISDDYHDLYKYDDTAAAYGISAGYLSIAGPIEAAIFKKADKNDYTFHFSLGLVL